MAIYTMTVRELSEQGFDFGLQNYPIWDESAREALNNAIIQHYYFREIGLETPQLFRFFLNRAMNEIMPYYCELWKTTQYNIDPTQAINVTEIYESIENLTGRRDTDGAFSEYGNGTETATRTPSLKNTILHSDTPQGILSTGDIESEKYLTSADIQKQEGTDTTQNVTDTKHETATRGVDRNTQKRDNNFTRTRKGNEFSDISALIRSYRETIITIVQEIVENPKIAECFMTIY